MKKNRKNETEERMDLLETKKNYNDIYKLQKREKDEDEDNYEKYRVEDIDFYSQSSNDDIETKMNKMIEIKRKGGNLQDYLHSRDISRTQKIQIVAKNFEQKQDKKQQQKKEERLMKLKKGLEKCNSIISKILRNNAYKKLIKKLKDKIKIKTGCEIINNLHTIKKKNQRKKYFDFFLKYSNENKMKRNIEKLKKEKEEKAKKEKEEKAKKEKEEKEKKEQVNVKGKEEKHKFLKEDTKNIEKEDSKINDDDKNKTNVKGTKITPSSKTKIEDNKADDNVEKAYNRMPILNEKGKKISSKKEQLENLKKNKENFYQKMNLQSFRKFEEMKVIEKQLDKQRKKFNKIKEGLNVSDTESNISFDLLPAKESIEKGLFVLKKFFETKLEKNFFKTLKRSEKKRKTTRMDTYSSQKRVLPKEKKSKNSFVDLQKFQSEKSLFKRNSQLSQTKKLDKDKSSKGVKEIEEEQTSFFLDEESERSETFIQINKDRDMLIEVDKSQLVEYDLFYKEQFFKNDVFKYDVNDIQDKEVQEINHEMNKLEAKRNLIAKKKKKMPRPRRDWIPQR